MKGVLSQIIEKTTHQKMGVFSTPPPHNSIKRYWMGGWFFWTPLFCVLGMNVTESRISIRRAHILSSKLRFGKRTRGPRSEWLGRRIHSWLFGRWCAFGGYMLLHTIRPHFGVLRSLSLVFIYRQKEKEWELFFVSRIELFGLKFPQTPSTW